MLKRISVESILVMLLFIMFTASIGVLIVEGQESYEAIIKNKNENEDIRIAISYISKKVKQNNKLNFIEVVDNPYNDFKALKIKLSGIEEGYFNYIFYDDKGIYEVLLEENEILDKSLGELIIELPNPIVFDFDSEFNLLKIKYEYHEDVFIEILDEVVSHEE